MIFFLALFIPLCFNFSFFGMELPKTELPGSSNQEVATLHLYNFQANDELLNRPQVWFSYKQENLFEACLISDKIREILKNSKPLLLALRLCQEELLNQKKNECIKLAQALNLATNILTARIIDCKSEYQQTPARHQLSEYITRTFHYLIDTKRADPNKQLYLIAKLRDVDHDIIELEDAFNSLRNYIHNNL